jgi:acetoin utilization deacetylase AcuC-like enzyme
MSSINLTWSAQGRPDLRDYGIQIPLLASRAEQILAHLRQRHTDAIDRSLRELRAIPLTAEMMKLAHSQRYVDDICGENAALRVAQCYELFDADGRPNRYSADSATRPLSELAMFQRMEADLSLQSARIALKEGFAYFLGGGMHHASRDHGRGFCLINDIVILSRVLQKEGRIKTVWVIDDDAHKGDGTASLCKFDDSIITLSIHMAHGWPLDEPRILPDGSPNPAYDPSDIDIDIAANEKHTYIDRLQNGLESLRRHFPRPDFAVVVNGSDPSELDRLPSTSGLRLDAATMLKRDLSVYDFLNRQQIPQLWLMAGGYGPDVWKIHAEFLNALFTNSTPQ